MSDTDLTTALAVAEAQPEVRTVLDLIEDMKPALIRSLQSEAAAEILTRHYFTAIRFNPLLMQCTGESCVGALLLTAQLRLEPGPLGHVYLVPFKKGNVHEIVFMLGYTGIVELGRRGGAAGLRSTVIWDCDEWSGIRENQSGLSYDLAHGPESEREERIGVLVSWKESGDTRRTAVFCPPSRIDAALKASPMKDTSRRGEDWYWRKTGVRFARPWLPLTTELATAVRADDAVVTGVDDGQPELTEAENGS